jgi:AbrB family looped-hinge helix DNA binding protein
MDRAGRIAVPNDVRRRNRLRAGTKFLVTELPDGRIVLNRLDPRQLASQLQEELKGIDIQAEVERVHREMQDVAAKWYPDTAARLKKRG